jgi:hypothetical protein
VSALGSTGRLIHVRAGDPEGARFVQRGSWAGERGGLLVLDPGAAGGAVVLSDLDVMHARQQGYLWRAKEGLDLLVRAAEARTVRTLLVEDAYIDPGRPNVVQTVRQAALAIGLLVGALSAQSGWRTVIDVVYVPAASWQTLLGIQGSVPSSERKARAIERFRADLTAAGRAEAGCLKGRAAELADAWCMAAWWFERAISPVSESAAGRRARLARMVTK